MLPKTFLSLSFTDAAFVRAVSSRLPRGLAYFYEKSFGNGELIVSEMEKAVSDTALFVLFASKASLASTAVLFEIDQVRAKLVLQRNVKLLIFPTDRDVSFTDLPDWLQSHWVGGAGYTPSDVARYITAVLLSPEVGLISPIKVVGRGATSDQLDRLVADHLQQQKEMPRIFVLAGFTGVGRKTFADHYVRTSLAAQANLAFGPTLALPAQADAVDLYRALAVETASVDGSKTLAADQQAFQESEPSEQVSELIRLMTHFWQLGQAVTIFTTSGFFEDRGAPKIWVDELLTAIPQTATLFLVTNRRFDEDRLQAYGTAVQIHIGELSSKDVRALMNYTASRLGVEDFRAPDQLVEAIGGHPDVANAAVRLAQRRGITILEKDPAQLLNIQQTILGDVVEGTALTSAEKAILDALGWVPSLGGDLLGEIVEQGAGVAEVDFLEATQGLLTSCLITITGYRFSISPAIRHLYRRRFVTPDEIIGALGTVLGRAWQSFEASGDFREDVFEASVFIHSMTGQDIPDALKKMISPGLLGNLVSETYAKAKDSDDEQDLRRVIALGSMSKTMIMSEATREDILSNVTRAQIRMSDYDGADQTLAYIRDKNYESFEFLSGHKLRRQEKYPEAIKMLTSALEGFKYNRSAIHELALAYQRSDNIPKLTELLERHGNKVRDSAMLTDFQIGLDLARNQGAKVEAGIKRLRAMPDDQGRSDRREAQLLIKQGLHGKAQALLTSLIERRMGSRFMLRSLRAKAASWAGDFRTAQRDLEFVRSVPGRREVAVRLEAELRAAQGDYPGAEALLSTVQPHRAQDHLLLARIYELKSEDASTGYADRQALRSKVLELRARHGAAVDDYED